jgi:response regulator RpfG family c-di-GMP phosphodiesterase
LQIQSGHGAMTNRWAHFLILDDDPEDAEAIALHVRAILKTVDLEIETKILTNSTGLQKELELHPDFFICDVRLSDTGGAAGLALVQNFKPRFPHVNFIAITMEFDKLKGLSDVSIQPDLILSKLKLLSVKSDEFDNYLLGYFIINRRQNRGLEISTPSEVEAVCKKALGWQQFDTELFKCLIRQVFKSFDLQLNASQFSSKNNDVIPRQFCGEIVDFVKLSKIERQGKSGSAVFKAATKFRNEPHKVGAVAMCVGIDFGAISSVRSLPHHAARSMI